MSINDQKKAPSGEVPSTQEKAHCKFNPKFGNLHNDRWIYVCVVVVVILLFGLFFIYISTYTSNQAFRGLGVMAGTLVLHMCMEFAMTKKRRFPMDEALTLYKQQVLSYYEARKYMHIIGAPLLLVAYIYGFAMLLSLFEQELVSDFHPYIIYLLWVVFFGLAIMIGVQLKKELQILKSLIDDNTVS